MTPQEMRERAKQDDDLTFHGAMTPIIPQCAVENGWIIVTLNGQSMCAHEFRAPTTK